MTGNPDRYDILSQLAAGDASIAWNADDFRLSTPELLDEGIWVEVHFHRPVWRYSWRLGGSSWRLGLAKEIARVEALLERVETAFRSAA